MSPHIDVSQHIKGRSYVELVSMGHEPIFDVGAGTPCFFGSKDLKFEEKVGGPSVGGSFWL